MVEVQIKKMHLDSCTFHGLLHRFLNLNYHRGKIHTSAKCKKSLV